MERESAVTWWRAGLNLAGGQEIVLREGLELSWDDPEVGIHIFVASQERQKSK